MKRIAAMLLLCAPAIPAAAGRPPLRVVKDIAYRTAASSADTKKLTCICRRARRTRR
jgi:hypothetical protein